MIYKLLTVSAVLVCLSVTVSAAYRGPERTRFIEKIAEQADKAEVEFDKRRVEYCKEYGRQFATNPSAWTSVRTSCLESSVLDLENIDSDNELVQKNSEKVFEMYRKCSKLTANPCDDEDWAKIKQCVREVYVTVPEFKAEVIKIGEDDIHEPHVVTEDSESEDLVVGMYVNVALINRERLFDLIAGTKLAECTRKTLLVASS